MQLPDNWKELPKKKRKKLVKEKKRREKRRRKKIANIRNWSIITLVALILVVSVYYWWANRVILPPTDIAGHIEQSPKSHILNQPMPIAIQKHMLEHADGEGKPGVVINYNCQDFDCSDDLIPKLKEIARRDEYKDFVYLAPFSGMDAKIALTKLGAIKTLDKLDEEKIREFIGR